MAIPTRNEVPEELTWDLTRVFKNDEAWEKEYQSVKSTTTCHADQRFSSR